MATIQELLSGNIVKPRQQAPNPMEGLGTLLGFLSQGQVQMPQLQPMPESRPVDAGAAMHMMDQNRKAQKDKEALEYRQKLIGAPGTDKVSTPWKDAHDATDGTGYLGGKLSQMQLMAGLSASPGEADSAAGWAMMNDQLQPRNPTPLQHMTMGVPGKDGYIQNAILSPDGSMQPIGEPWKQSSGVNIDLGNGTQMRPATSEEKRQWNYSPDTPATKNTKTGEVVPHPNAVTEDQAKSGMFHGALSRAVSDMRNSMSYISQSPLKDPVQWTLDSVTGMHIPMISDVTNSKLEPIRQKFNQQRAQALTAIIHSMSGSGFSAEEQKTKAEAMVPKWGDKQEVIDSKLKEMESVSNDLKARAGAGVHSQEPSKPKDGLERATSKSGKPMVKVNGQWEYE